MAEKEPDSDLKRQSQLRAAVEKRVERRTVELSSANDALVAEMALRRRAEDETRLLLDIYRSIHNTDDYKYALQTALRRICEFANWDRGEAWIPNDDGAALVLAASWYAERGEVAQLEERRKHFSFAPNAGLIGRVWVSKLSEWVPDLTRNTGTTHRPYLIDAGVKATFAVPILSNDEVVAVLTFLLFEKREADRRLIDIISAVAGQLGSVIHHKQTEEELRNSEARFRAVVDNSTRVIYLKDRELRYLTVNGEFERLFDVTKEAVRGKSDYDLFPKEAADRFRANDLQVIEKAVPMEFEEVASHRDGSQVYLSNKYPMFDSLGKLYAICGISTDITEQKRQEEALRSARDNLSEEARKAAAELVGINQQLLLSNRQKERALEELRKEKELSQKLIDTAQVAILLLDTQGQVIYANPYFEQATGYALRELKAQEPMGLIAERDRRDHVRLFQDALSGHAVAGVVSKVLTKSGGEREFEWYAVPLKDADRTITGMLSTGLDITERRRAEVWFKTLIHTTQDALLSIDRQARIVLFNPAAERIFGYRQNEVAGKKVNMLMAQPYATEHDNYIERYEATREPHAIGRIRTVMAKRKSGELFPIELSVTEIASDEDVHYAAFIRDISEKTKLQNELVEKEKLATIGMTAAKIGHELGNPLNSISLALQVLEQRMRNISTPEEGQRSASSVMKIRDEVSRLNKLLLDFRAIARKETYRLRRTALGELIDDLIELEGPRLANEHVALEKQLPHDLPELIVDRDKLKQVLLNLCKNAAEAMPQGGKITFKTSVIKKEIVLEVSDTGTGLPTDTDIFEPFFTTKRDGTGLGLTIVRQMVAGHGGTITYRSEAGKGTTFRITLPLNGPRGAGV